MRFKGWETTKIKSDDGNEVSAIQPVIVSASRSTDIPAFHHKWFYDRLQKGHVLWTNPFNRAKQYVSFSKTRVFVFWTKNPEIFMQRLKELDEKKFNYYFQFTLNDYENEKLEPHVPEIKKRIDTFKRLADNIGKEKVVWRFDPLLLTNKVTPSILINKIASIASRLKDHTEKLIISFADIECYQKVKRNLCNAGIIWREFTPEELDKIGMELKQVGQQFKLEVSTCSEKIDLSDYGISHGKCIDDDMMDRLFHGDKALMKFLGRENPAASLFPNFKEIKGADLKDKGQRKECGCIVSKDIGQYNTCMHLCTYCYANFSEAVVRNNFMKKESSDCESVLGL